MVSTPWVETIVEEGRRKQAEAEGEAGSELLDDLPWGETSLVGIGASQVEVELVEGNLGHELVFDEAVDGLDIALIGVGAGGDALVLGAEEGEGGGEAGAGAVRLEGANELAAVIGLPDEVFKLPPAWRCD